MRHGASPPVDPPLLLGRLCPVVTAFQPSIAATVRCHGVACQEVQRANSVLGWRLLAGWRCFLRLGALPAPVPEY